MAVLVGSVVLILFVFSLAVVCGFEATALHPIEVVQKTRLSPNSLNQSLPNRGYCKTLFKVAEKPKILLSNNTPKYLTKSW